MSILKTASTTLSGKLVIPNSVTSIGISAFARCSSLTSINIPNSVTSIGISAFARCSNLTSINIPNSVTSIGDKAFYYCASLTSINIPNSVTSIGISAFDNCSKLTSINIPNSVTSIGSYAFYYCISLTSINIPNSVTSIDNYVFYYCTSLTSINIPNSVTSIGNKAFYYCISLTSINIPDSVTSIGTEAFYDLPQMPKGNYIYENKLYENGELFTGTKDDIEYNNGVKLVFTGENFCCYLKNVNNYENKYTVIEFTPAYSQEYSFNRNNSSNNTVITIKTNKNDITLGQYTADDEDYHEYLNAGTTYYIGVANYSDTSGYIELDVSPYYYESSSSSQQSSSY